MGKYSTFAFFRARFHVFGSFRRCAAGLRSLKNTYSEKAGPVRIDDIEKMTGFADYIVPVALRVLGITSYSPALEHAINTYQMIPRNSSQEVEIRAHSLYATALLREEINKLRLPDQQVIIPQVNERLWTHYHTTVWPHHLTRTIMY